MISNMRHVHGEVGHGMEPAVLVLQGASNEFMNWLMQAVEH